MKNNKFQVLDCNELQGINGGNKTIGKFIEGFFAVMGALQTSADIVDGFVDGYNGKPF